MTVVDGTTDMLFLHLVKTDDLILHVEHIFQFTHQVVVIPGLGDEVGSTVFQSLDSQVDIGIGSQQYDRRLRMLLTDGPKPEQSFVAAIDTEGEVHVEQHYVDRMLGH